jgi:hypothetical protein
MQPPEEGTRTLMRTEIENAVAEIRQGITLLRRHL